MRTLRYIVILIAFVLTVVSTKIVFRRFWWQVLNLLLQTTDVFKNGNCHVNNKYEVLGAVMKVDTID